MFALEHEARVVHCIIRQIPGPGHGIVSAWLTWQAMEVQRRGALFAASPAYRFWRRILWPWCDHVWGYSCRLLWWHAALGVFVDLQACAFTTSIWQTVGRDLGWIRSRHATIWWYDVIERLRFEGLHQLQGTEQSLETWIQVGWVSIAVELKVLDMILWKKHNLTHETSLPANQY